MKDYELEGSEGDYFNRIIDKETLVGKVQRTGDVTRDVLVNDGGSIKDTGLYELYVNVVVPFVDAMIEEGERYAGIAHPEVTGEELPTDNWISRGSTSVNGFGPKGCEGTTPQTCAGEHGPGMSYCFGCKQDVASYNLAVSKRKAPPNDVYSSVPDDYKGDIDDSTGNIGATTDKKRWAGLNSKEINADSFNQPFHPWYWAGIDCSGFVSRTLQSAGETLNANETTIVNLDVPVQIHPTDTSRTANYTEDVAMDWVGNNTFFTVNDISYSQRFSRVQKLIRRGDILNYGGGYISIVYSDRPACTEDENGKATYTYEIIHAYGGDDDKGMYRYPDIPEAGANRNKRVFGRKVIKTWNNIANPTGFGRLKLWN